MQERIVIDQLRCENCVNRLAGNFSTCRRNQRCPSQLGTSTVVIDYDDSSKDAVDAAIKKSGFEIIERNPVA